MVDTKDQNQVGPPLAAATPTMTAASTPSSRVSTEQLDEVTALVELFADLAGVVREVDDRTRILERYRRETRGDNESPEIKRIWISAIEPLTQYLAQPIQLAPGAKPVQLADAAEQFSAWVATFKEDAVGPGGQGLQHDPRRLTAFEAKLNGVDPSPAWVEQEGQRLLIRPELDPPTVHRTIAATTQSLTEDQERTANIDQALMSFDQEWEASISPLENELRERRDELQLLLSTPSISEQLRRQAQNGLKAIAAISTGDLVTTRVSLGEWIEKYRTDPNFTSEQVQQRINQEIRPEIRRLQAKVEEIKHSWTTTALQSKEQSAKQQVAQTRLKTLNQAIENIRTRYTALVNLRRVKLGQEPDERFFGEIARLVNSAITDLGNLEADLLALQTKLQTDSSSKDESIIQNLLMRVQAVLKQSDDYANTEQLERRLAAHAKAIEREQLRAAASERQRAKEAAQQQQKQKQAEERQAKNELRRQQHLDRQLRSSTQAKATQELLERQQSFDQELRAYVTELTQASQERQRHAETIAKLITSERQSVDEDRHQFLESKAERRAMTASEATAWLAQLAERERLLNERQERLSQLTQELHALQATTSSDRRLTQLRERLASNSPVPASSTHEPSANKSETEDAPVKIAIGRRQ